MPAKRVAKKASNKNNPRKAKSSRLAPADIGADDIKRLAKAPGDYENVARKFADALEWTKFRGPISPQRLRSMVARGERLGQRAIAAQIKATAADRQRIVQESKAWKSMLSAWRLVVAAMPDRPELEEPFAFMQDYMSVSRTAPPPSAPAS